MMIGEYEFENNFSFDATREKGGRNFSIQLMFVLFMIYGSVIVMNLIVAIIVNLMDMDQVEAMLQESRVEDISEKIHVTSVYKQCCLWLFRQSQTKNKMEMETGQMIESQIEQQTYPMIEVAKEDGKTKMSFSSLRDRRHVSIIKNGKNFKKTFGKNVTLAKEVISATLNTLRRKRDDNLHMIRKIKKIQSQS